MPAANRYRIGDHLLTVDRNLLEREAGSAQTLEPRAVELLAYLADRAGEVVSVEELLGDLWRGRLVTDSSVYRLVAGLRRTLGDRASAPRYIETIRKRGYRLLAPVEVLDEAGRDGAGAVIVRRPAAAPAATAPAGNRPPPCAAAATAPEPISSGPLRPSRERQPRRAALAAAVAALMIVAVALVWLLTGREPTGDAATGSGSGGGGSGRQTVAVLPFESLAPATTPAYLTDGLARALSDRLAAIPELRVIAYPSVRAAVKGSNAPASLAQTLGVELLLSGTLQATGEAADDEVRITVALLEVASGEQRFTWTWRGRLGEVLSLDETFAATVARRLDLAVLSPARPRGAGTTDLTAYRATLEARAALEQGFQRETLTLAIEGFTAALAADDSYVPALAGRAVGHLRLYLNYLDRSDARLALAKADVDLALALAPDDARALYAHGYYLQVTGDVERARTVFENALRRRPSSADILMALCRVHARLADLAGALAACTAATEVDPRNAVYHYELGLTEMVAERFAEAERSFATALALDPQLIEAHLYRAVVYMAWLGDRAAANVELYEAAQKLGFDGLIPVLLQPGTWGLLTWGDASFRQRVAAWDPVEDGGDAAAWHLTMAEYAAFKDARREQAATHYEQALRLRRQDVAERPSDPWLVAEMGIAYAGLGDDEAAMAAMDQALTIAPVEEDPWTNVDFLWLRATALVMLDRFDEAAAQVAAAVRYPGPMTPQMLRAEPLWAPMFERQAFQALLDEGGRRWRDGAGASAGSGPGASP